MICSTVYGDNDSEFGVAFDADKLTPYHITLINGSTPVVRKLEKIPGCDMDNGTFVTDNDRDENGRYVPSCTLLL